MGDNRGMSDADARRHLAESLLAEEVPAKPSPGEFGFGLPPLCLLRRHLQLIGTSCRQFALFFRVVQSITGKL